MPRIRDRIWINTAKDEEVQKHRFLAGLQSIRNNFLKWKIKNIKLDSARIEPRNGREYGPRGDRVYDCLELLSKDLSDPTNRAEANNAIKSLVGNSEDWNDPLTIVLPLKADKLQQLRMNVKVLFTEYSFDTKATAFLQAVYNKSDAVLAGPKGYYHKKFDAPAPRELPLATNAPPQANADVPPPADPPPPADAPPPPKLEIKTEGQPAAPSTDQIAQLQEKAPEEKTGQTRKPAHKRINSENKPVPALRLRDHGKPARQNGSEPSQTPRSDVPRSPRLPLSSASQGRANCEELNFEELTEAMDTPIRRGIGLPPTPRRRLESSTVQQEASVRSAQKIQSPRSPLPAPVTSREAVDAKLDGLLDGLNSLIESQPSIPDVASEVMEPIVKVEDTGSSNDPATLAMPVPAAPTTTPEPEVEPQTAASATLSGAAPTGSVPQTPLRTLEESVTEPEPAPRSHEQQKTDRLMKQLLTVMNGRRPLLHVFETLDELAELPQDNELKPYRANSLELVKALMPEKSALEYVSNAMHSIKVDLKSNLNYFVPRLSQTKRDRLKIIVEEWGKLGLATGEPSRFNAGELPDLKDALIDCRLGLLPTGPAKGNG